MFRSFLTRSRCSIRSSDKVVVSSLFKSFAVQSFATGPSKGGDISDELLTKLGSLSTQALVDGLWVMGWPSAQINGSRPLAPTMKCVGRAVTLNFVPARPDIAQSKPAGGNSPEYEAFELCGPKEVLVMSSVGPYESVGGDIKFLRLKQREIGGLVTDGTFLRFCIVLLALSQIIDLLHRDVFSVLNQALSVTRMRLSTTVFHALHTRPQLDRDQPRCNHGNAMALSRLRELWFVLVMLLLVIRMV